MRCKKIRDWFDLALDQQLPPPLQTQLEEHLTRCQDCRREYQEMRAMVDLIRRKRPAIPREDFFADYWIRLNQRMQREGLSITSGIRVPAPDLFFLRRRPVWQGLAALILVALGILIGRVFLPTSGKTGIQEEYQSVRKQSSMSPQLAASTREYIDQSKVLLLALINFDSSRDEHQALNFPRQAEISDTLVRQAADLKGRLADARQQRLLELVEDLEVILLQIANLGEDPDLSSIRMIGDGVDKRGIIFKIQLLELQQSVRMHKKQTI